MFPPAVSGAVKVLGATEEANSKMPPPEPLALSTAAGNCCSTEEGTVKLPAPAVVVQMNVHESVTALVPVPVVALDPPMISTRSLAFPPVHVSGSPALRFTTAGNP